LFVIVIDVREVLVRTAVPAAPVPPPPENVTEGVAP